MGVHAQRRLLVVAERPYDLVLFGATGFTGRLVAEALLRQSTEGLRWAIAGRDPRKLMDVKMALVGADRRAGTVGVLTADTTHPASLRQLAEQTRVLASTVGPYAVHGEGVVAACVQASTHYLDITGEAAFVRNVAHLFHRQARRRGVKLVCCCGFDAIPADLGARYTVQQLTGGPRRVFAYLRVRARPSGGSWSSLLEALARSGRRPPGTLRSRGPKPPGAHRAPPEVSGGWALPLPSVDPLVVQCTAESLPRTYGADFLYGHYLRMGSSRRAASVIAGAAAVAITTRLPMGKRLLELQLPAGEGPSDERRARSYFDLTFVGSSPGQRVVTRVSGGDPGYTETSRMFAACACLLTSHSDSLPSRSGLLSPAIAFDDHLQPRLEAQGMRFTTLSAPSPGPAAKTLPE